MFSSPKGSESIDLFSQKPETALLRRKKNATKQAAYRARKKLAVAIAEEKLAAAGQPKAPTLATVLKAWKPVIGAVEPTAKTPAVEATRQALLSLFEVVASASPDPLAPPPII